ncbi:MAG: hypothetical protein AB1589_23120 [Cyanobacteriota bacterium]|jgi:hypothetical protein
MTLEELAYLERTGTLPSKRDEPGYYALTSDDLLKQAHWEAINRERERTRALAMEGVSYPIELLAAAGGMGLPSKAPQVTTQGAKSPKKPISFTKQQREILQQELAKLPPRQQPDIPIGPSTPTPKPIQETPITAPATPSRQLELPFPKPQMSHVDILRMYKDSNPGMGYTDIINAKIKAGDWKDPKPLQAEYNANLKRITQLIREGRNKEAGKIAAANSALGEAARLLKNRKE